ncbi:MAG: tetraacyldisaccharide 4'-kinase [Parvularculaceae bacterium]|nr:tetraacyldisaccharide 4'-kinase [Parvularculaceae bacterium]
MKEPWFWRDNSMAASAVGVLLSPLSFLYDAGQRWRAATTRASRAGAPVICIGNASLGGTGKTPFALMLNALLKERGLVAHFATRGFGGALEGRVRVDETHTARDVGDEALLLARAAPTFVARNRLAGVRAAASGADIVIMDDGFQNPSVAKDFSILIVNSADHSAGRRVFPAGPMREPLKRAIARADALALNGDLGGHLDTAGKPLFRLATHIVDAPAPQKVIAFCGIANPARFFDSVDRAGMSMAGKIAFADHHPFTPGDIAMLRQRAKREHARLITTEKDFVRLPADARADVMTLEIAMTLDDPAGLVDLILTKIGKSA